MRFRIFLLMLLGTSLLSCKKRLKCEDAIQLTDENTSFLVGNWKWVYTVRTINDGSGINEVDTIYSNNSNNKYCVDFLEEGKVTLYKNNKIEDEYCVLDTSNYPNSNQIYIYFNDKNDCENSMQYYENGSSNLSLITFYNINFPFFHYEYNESSGIQTFNKNYFQKQ